ncbi:MAG: hypothetical protein HQK77_18150 [Desulfobacterales bacterium]|nr:hypothetical protein [Desulfobacterales bacterium]
MNIQYVLWLICLCYVINPCYDQQVLADIQNYFNDHTETGSYRDTEQWLDYPNNLADYPGVIIGQDCSQCQQLFNEKWQYRKLTYEILCSKQDMLAEMVYCLALFSHDLNKTISLEKFKKGAQGFHYSIDQVVEWANAVTNNPRHFFKIAFEKMFFDLLQKDKVIIKKNGFFEPADQILHVLGVSSGTKRTIEFNLNHERIHIFWDQNSAFREYYIEKWNRLSSEEKQESIQALKGYNTENELLMIEEWTVRQNESVSIMELSKKWK